MITCAIFRLFPWCLQPQIPRETNISLCRCPAVKHQWWVCEYRRCWIISQNPPAISCHEDQFPHVVEQINTTKKRHFFHLPNATIGHQCLGFHTLRTWPKSFPQLRWVQDFWFAHDKIWNHHVESWLTNMFFWKLHVQNQKSCWHCSYLYSKSYPKTVDRFGRDMSNMSSTMIIPFWLPKYKQRLC